MVSAQVVDAEVTSGTTNRSDMRGELRNYRQMHDGQDAAQVGARKRDYRDLVVSYYNLATDFYERGWGKSFHFAPRYKGERLDASLTRHEHFLALRLGLEPGMRVLDVGCGVGGPLRQIARFSGANVVGVNNNAYQLEKARRYTSEAGLDRQCDFLEADFTKLPVADASFDAAFAIEATCHAPTPASVFREVERVLKAGASMAGYDWCLTDRFDASDPEHLRIKSGIEEGDGLADIATIAELRQALEASGLEVLQLRDLASESEVPWYQPLTPDERSFTALRRTHVGQRLTKGALKFFEGLGKVPKGSAEISATLNLGADALVEGGRSGVFTPLVFFHVRKP